jgi:hypothetical protein
MMVDSYPEVSLALNDQRRAGLFKRFQMGQTPRVPTFRGINVLNSIAIDLFCTMMDDYCEVFVALKCQGRAPC